MKKERLRNIWQYPRGTTILHKNKEYTFVTYSRELGAVLFDGFSIIYDDEISDSEEDEVLIKEFKGDSINKLFLGTAAYTLALAEDIEVNIDSINTNMKILNVIKDIAKGV